MSNEELRAYARAKRVKQWEIAEELGITECKLSRELRHELSPEDTERLRKAIDLVVCKR